MYKVSEAYNRHRKTFDSLLVGAGIEGVEEHSIDIPPGGTPYIGPILGKLVMYRFASNDFPGVLKPLGKTTMEITPSLELVFEPKEHYEGLANAWGIRIGYRQFTTLISDVEANDMIAIPHKDPLVIEDYRVAIGQSQDQDLFDNTHGNSRILTDARFKSAEEFEEEAVHAVNLLEAAGSVISKVALDTSMHEIREGFRTPPFY